MIALLHSLNAWHWLGFGLVLLIIEILANVGFLLWIGIAACMVALALSLFPLLAWPYQFLLFSGSAIGSILIWRRWYSRRSATASDAPTLNRRSAQYIGRTFTLTEPMSNGRGRVNVDDSTWQIASDEDLPAGTQVIVTQVDGVLLLVKRLQ